MGQAVTLSDLMKTDMDDIFLSTDDFAESIVRYAGGSQSSSSVVTAVIMWDPTTVEGGRGRQTARTGQLLLNDDVSVTVSDAFMVEGNRVEVESIGPIQDGARTVWIKQVIPETRGAVPIRTGDI